jgi:TrmH family RNA methyltransferase
MGSIGRVTVNYLDFFQLPKLLPPGTPIYLADIAGIDVQSLEIDRPSILVIGSESHGVSTEIYQEHVVSIAIPRHANSRAESLNAAMATTALLALLT